MGQDASLKQITEILWKKLCIQWIFFVFVLRIDNSVQLYKFRGYYNISKYENTSPNVKGSFFRYVGQNETVDNLMCYSKGW